MAAIKFIKRTVSLDGGPVSDPSPNAFFDGEQGAHTFIIAAMRGGEPLMLSGAVSGVFLNPNDAGIPLSGFIVDGAAVLTLSDNCYALSGRFTLTIDVNGATIYECQSRVRKRSSATAYDPTGEISVGRLAAEIAEMRTATAEANAAGHSLLYALEDMIGGTVGPVLPGKAVYISNGALADPVTSATFGYCQLSCEQGDQFRLTGTGGNNARLWIIADVSGNVLSNAAAYEIQEDYILTVSQANAAKIVFNVQLSSPYAIIKGDLLIDTVNAIDAAALKASGHVCNSASTFVSPYDSLLTVPCGEVVSYAGYIPSDGPVGLRDTSTVLTINYSNSAALPGSVQILFDRVRAWYRYSTESSAYRAWVLIPTPAEVDAALTNAKAYADGKYTDAVTHADTLNSNTSAALADAVQGVEAVTGNLVGVLTHGKAVYISNGAVQPPTDSATFGYVEMPCAAGDRFTVTGTGGSNARLWIIANSSGTVLSMAETFAIMDGDVLIVSDANAAKIYFNCQLSSAYSIVKNALLKYQVDSVVTPEMFGAKGDDSTDDKAAIEAAIATGKPVAFTGGKTYRVSSGAIALSEFHLIGNGARIRFGANGGFNVSLQNGNHQYMENLRLAGNWSGVAISITPEMQSNGYPAQPGLGSMYKNVSITTFFDGFYVNMITWQGVANTVAAACIRIDGMEIYNCVRYGMALFAGDSILNNIMITRCLYGLYMIGGNTLSDAKLFWNGDLHLDQAPSRTSCANTYGLKIEGRRFSVSGVNCQDNYFHGAVINGSGQGVISGLYCDSNNRWWKEYADNEDVQAAMDGLEGAGIVVSNSNGIILRGVTDTAGSNDSQPRHTQHVGCEITGNTNCDVLILEDRMTLPSVVSGNTGCTIRLTAAET